MSVQFKSFQEILGDMLRKIMAVTGANDLNKGSVLMTLLEAAAQEDFAQYGALIEVLDNYSLDSTSGIDLDKRAAEFNLLRLAATRASGFVTISDSTMSKVSTGLYIGASPPIAGDNVIKVNDASEITFPGSIYIGRSTPNFEGPIVLGGAPIDNGSYWEVPLNTPLVKNHNLNETVILAQKGDRVISAGTLVRIPPNNISSSVAFKVSNDQILADGEQVLNNILVFASAPGSTGNAPLKSISEFEVIPFNGAIVTNPSPFSNARDLETDQELRDRIKDTIQSLSRGTKTSILSGVIGIADSDDNKRVASASLIEPTVVTDIAQLFIDDGTGFEPSYSGQGLENLILDAAGTEQFLQLGNYPLVKAQAESENAQPYEIPNGATLVVRVNDEEETITFLASDFDSTTSAKTLEVVQAINDRSNLIEARTTDGQKKVVIFAKALNNEKLQVVGGSANDSLLFSTDPIYTLRLYKNDQLLTKDGITAFVESDSFTNWTAFGVPSTFNIQVDGKPIQYFRISDNLLEVSVDRATYVPFSGTTFNDLGTALITASLDQWAAVLDQLISGAEVTVNGNKLKITSNQEATGDSKVQILDLDTPNNLISSQGWSTDLIEGASSDYTLNRFNGQIELAQPLTAGDSITAGTENTKGDITSAIFSGGTVDLSLDTGRTPDLYVVIDGEVVVRNLNATAGSTSMTVAAVGSRYRYTASDPAFTDLFIGDYIVVQQHTADPWIGAVNTGIFRVEVVDLLGYYFEVSNPIGANGGGAGTYVNDALDIQAFSSTRPPQKIALTVGVNTLSQVVDKINETLVGGMAEAQDDNTIRIATNTFDSEVGSITIPVSAANASNFEFSRETYASLTSHTGSVHSVSEVGFRIPGAFGTITTDDITDPYTDVIDTSRSFNSDGTLPNQWVKYQDGINEDVKGIIRSIAGPNQLLLRDNSPSLVGPDFLAPVGAGHNYQQFDAFDLQDTDNLVVVLDGDEVNKTNNVPLSRRGRISSAFNSTTFDGVDVDANVLSTSFGDTLWDGYDFSDYKIWFKARNVVNPTNDQNAIIFRAANFGPSGERIRVSYAYSRTPDSDLSVSMTPGGAFTTVTVSLATDSARSTTQQGNTKLHITTGAGTTTYTYGTTFTVAAPGTPGANRVSNVVTIVTTAPHGLAPGQQVTVSGVDDASFDGTFTVATAPSTTSFTYAQIAADASSGNGTVFAAIGTNPGFGTVAVGDIVTFNSVHFNSANNGTFKISATDNSTYITVLNPSGVAEDRILGAASAMVIYPLLGTTGADIVDIVNDTSPVNEILEAVLTDKDPDSLTNLGSGSVDYSTADDPAIASQYIALVDSENWIRDFSNPLSPHFTLKQPLSFINVVGGAGFIYELGTAPVYNTSDLGEPFRLIPMTAKNLDDHLNASTISSLSLNANIQRSDNGERIQISSQLVGSQGQVEVAGGLGNSNLMTVKGNTSIEGGYLKTSVLSAAAGGFHATQRIKLENQFTTKKVNTFDSATVVTTSTAAPKSYTLNQRTIGVDGTTHIGITLVSGNTYKATILSGSGDFSGVRVHDELRIPRTTSPFLPANEGTFPIVAAGASYIDFINPDADTADADITLTGASDFQVMVPFFTEWPKELAGDTEIKVQHLSQGVARYLWTGVGSDPNFLTNGIRVDDVVVVGGTSFAQGNRGRFAVIGVTDNFIEVVNENAVEEIVTIGDPFISSANTGNFGGDIAVTWSGGLTTFTIVPPTISWYITPAPGSKLYIPPTSPFHNDNQGVFTVVSSSGTSVTVINSNNRPEGPITLTALGDMQFENTFTFRTLDSAEAGDTLSVGALSTAWFQEENQGQFTISSVTRDALGHHQVEVADVDFAPSSDVITLGSNATSFYVIEDTPFITYRTIDNIVVNPSDADKQILYFTPTTHSNRISSSAGTQITALNKLGFPETPKEGIDGYKFWTGLLRRVQRTVDGYDADTLTFPGIKAAGVQLEVRPPLLQRITLGVDVKTKSGTPLSILIDSIKSSILSYVTSLGVGEDVILSEVVSKVQQVSGVEAVVITDPAPTNNTAPERIILQDNEKAIATEDDITVG